jgi:hypothetical protein
VSKGQALFASRGDSGAKAAGITDSELLRDRLLLDPANGPPGEFGFSNQPDFFATPNTAASYCLLSP